jgi:predicted DNA-binding WGR domain protein
MRRFELSDGSSNKFWQISRDGAELRVTFGKIGTSGQTQLKDLVTEAAAIAEHDKLIKEKTKKGYAETGAPTAPDGAETKAAPAPAKPAKAPKPAKTETVAEVPLPPVATPVAAPVAAAAPLDLAGVEPYTPEEKVVVAEEKATETELSGIAGVLATMNGYNSDLLTELAKGLKKTVPAMKGATEAMIAALKAKKGLASADRDQAAPLLRRWRFPGRQLPGGGLRLPVCRRCVRPQSRFPE